MTASSLRRVSLAAVLLLIAVAAIAQVAIPALKARVTDTTETLTPQQRALIEERLAAFEARKGTQLAVLIVPTTEPEDIAQFGIRVADEWKVGRKGVADGAILIVALKDRAMRIEVGRGLEGALNDATAKRIIAEIIAPRFKQGDFFGGIDAGLSRMMAVVDGEPLPPPKRAATAQGWGGWEQFAIVGFLLVFVVGGIVRAMFGRFVGSGLIGGLAGVAAWIMIGSLIAAVVIALIAWLLSLMGGMAGLPGRGGWNSGGSVGGWSGGGGSWGGGGSGGSWSGGGGDFGGGGASGQW